MESRFIWTEENIIAGTYVCRESWPEESNDISGLCSATYKLGWITGSKLCVCEVAVTDGLVILHEQTETKNAKQVIAEHFNSDDYGFRPLTHKQVMRRMKYLKSLHNQTHNT